MLTKTGYIACGQYCVRVLGSFVLPSKPRNSFVTLQNCADFDQVDLTLRLESLLTTKNELPEEGWSCSFYQNKHYAIYAEKREPIFAVAYEDSMSEITIHVRPEMSKAGMLGIQYGMMLGLYQKCVGLHGVTLLCGDEVVILSAPSGTGKTTLAHLLENYDDAIVINGDFALLSIEEGGVVFEPTPFCGSSGRCLNHRVQVNRVVFLEQSPTNQWRAITSREAISRFMDNSFIPTWDARIQQTVQENILKCISMLKVNVFSFAPTSIAAEMFSGQLRFNEE